MGTCEKLQLFATVFVLICSGEALGDSFTLDDWALSTGIIDTRNHFSSSFTPQPSPYISAQHVMVAPSEAHSYFDFSWTPDTASFLIAASHVAVDGNGGTRSLSSGNIYITPSVDLLLSAQGHYDWDLPAGAMAIQWGFVAWDFQSHEVYFSQGDMHTTFLHGPASGTFTINGQGVLPPNRQIVLQYNMILDTFGSTGLLATGAGEINFSLVPEPHMLALFTVGACLLRKKSFRR